MTSKKWLMTAVVVFSAAIGFGVSTAEARIKLRCVDPACVSECQANGGAGCFNLCRVDCESY